MPITPEITRDIARMSKPKRPKPHVEIRKALDMGPTPERMAKADYEDAASGKKALPTRKPSNNLEVLERRGLIGGDVVAAAIWWLRDWNLAKERVTDIDTPLPDDYLRGDEITFGLACAFAAERLALVRDAMGDNLYRWVVFVVAHRFSFSALGAALWPDSPQQTACERAMSSAAVALSKLTLAQKNARDVQKRRREDARENSSGTFR